MKTGTPVRIDGRSVHYELMDTQDGECDFHKFSFMNTSVRHLKQLQCWTCFTNEEAHNVLRNGLADSPLFNGQIQSIGPRYCPSIETKIVTFPDKEQHQLFLEPEGETTQELYLNGFSSSLPMEIQIEALKKIPAFKDLVIYRPGYAIEYDYFDPTQLKHTQEWTGIIDKIVDIEPGGIVLTGGEPLLRKDFFEIIRYLRSKYNGKVALATNATLINDDNVKLLAELIDKFDISIDGVDE